MCKVLICGGRTFGIDDREHKYMISRLQMLNEKRKPALIVHGAASGADTVAGNFFITMQVNTLAVPAKWKLYGKSAGFKRNTEMLDLVKVDLVVGFPGGIGTKMMLKLAKESNIETIDLTEDYNTWSTKITE